MRQYHPEKKRKKKKKLKTKTYCFHAKFSPRAHMANPWRPSYTHSNQQSPVNGTQKKTSLLASLCLHHATF